MSIPRKMLCEVVSIHDYGDGVFRIALHAGNRRIAFKAGQFLHLTLDAFDPAEGYWPESRVFSIASEPGSEFLEIVYSVKGTYTRRMADNLREGMHVWLKLPYGDFIVENHIADGQHPVFIAGGTGISPFIPYFHKVIKEKPGHPFSVYYGIRDSKHYLYKDILDKIFPISHVYVIEGLFDIEKTSKEICAIDKAVCFISGPPGMIHMFQDKLREYGFSSHSIIIDSWE